MAAQPRKLPPWRAARTMGRRRLRRLPPQAVRRRSVACHLGAPFRRAAPEPQPHCPWVVPQRMGPVLRPAGPSAARRATPAVPPHRGSPLPDSALAGTAYGAGVPRNWRRVPMTALVVRVSRRPSPVPAVVVRVSNASLPSLRCSRVRSWGRRCASHSHLASVPLVRRASQPRQSRALRLAPSSALPMVGAAERALPPSRRNAETRATRSFAPAHKPLAHAWGQRTRYSRSQAAPIARHLRQARQRRGTCSPSAGSRIDASFIEKALNEVYTAPIAG